MVSIPEITRPRGRFVEWAKRADDYFLSDANHDQTATKLANIRMGVMICLVFGTAILIFAPLQLSIWPARMVGALFAVGLATLGLPFVIRHTKAIERIGHFVCAEIALYMAAILVTSAGDSPGVLIVAPIVPMLALLTQGGRATVAWGAVSLGLLALGAGMILFLGEPLLPYRRPSPVFLYTVSLVCTLGMLGVTLLFERFWHSTTLEVANRARAEMIERDERYSNLLEHGSEGILVVDEASQITFASPAAERLVGLEPGQAVGQKLRHFTEPDDFERAQPIWQEILASPDAVGRVRIRTRGGLGIRGQGTARILELTLSNCLDNPAVRGIVIHQHDVTDLSRAESNYEILVERSLQGIAVVCDDRVVYANQALADLFGVRREALLVASDDDALTAIHRDDREAVKRAFNSTDPESPDRVEARFMRADGTWRWIQLRWSSCVWEGRPARQAAYADITAQKELEERSERYQEQLEARIQERTLELEESQRILRDQERLAAVGTLAAGIAHQINNPIGAILNSAEFATLVASEEDADRIRSEALDEIRGQAIRCGKIVRSILQFSRAEPTEKWASDLSSVLHIAVDVTTRFARERSATVEVDLSREVSEQAILMNPIEIEQVFVNLLRNAIEAQPLGAHVTVKCRLADGFVEISVADDGPGVPATDAHHIFEPFYTTRLRDGGSGLGLSVAHGIIKDHGGRMWLEPRDRSDGNGACFHVRLPLEKPDSELGIQAGSVRLP